MAITGASPIPDNKVSYMGGTTSRQKGRVKLAEKPSGCIVWNYFNDETSDLGPFYFFGGEPGHLMPSISDSKIARHPRGDARFNQTSYSSWFAGILNGKSMIAIHAEAIQTMLPNCDADLEMNGKKIIGLSKGPFDSSLLHAANFGVNFDEIIMIEPMMSFASIVSHMDYEPACIPFTVAEALMYYDLPDLVAGFAPKKLTTYSGLNHNDEMMDKSSLESIYSFVKSHYKSMDSENKFSIIDDSSGSLLKELLRN